MSAPDHNPEETSQRPEILESLLGNRRPSTIGGLVYMVVAVGVAISLAWAIWSWRDGLVCMGVVLLLAATARSVLPAHEAGMLAVRSRVFDVVGLAACGGVLIALAIGIPSQPV